MSALGTQDRLQAAPTEVDRYWRLVAYLAIAAFAMTILSAFVGYARLDVGQAISDALRGERVCRRWCWSSSGFPGRS